MSPQAEQLPPQIQALHEELEHVTTDEQLADLAQREDEVVAARAEFFDSMPKVGELAMKDGVIVELSDIEAERAAGHDMASHNTTGRQS